MPNTLFTRTVLHGEVISRPWDLNECCQASGAALVHRAFITHSSVRQVEHKFVVEYYLFHRYERGVSVKYSVPLPWDAILTYVGTDDRLMFFNHRGTTPWG